MFAEIRSGRFVLVLSATTLRELARAPEQVRQLLADLSNEHVEVLGQSAEVETLRDAYVESEVVGRSALLDAEHIAAASVAEVDLIVSWNFKHIVHFDKIRGYHGVNMVHGYRAIPIHSPSEVIAW